MNLRNITKEDIPIVLDMLTNMYNEINIPLEFTEEWLKSRISSRFFVNKLIEKDGDTAGFIITKIVKSEYTKGHDTMGFVYEMYVKNEYRKQGLAKLMLHEVEKELKDMGVNYIELYVSVHNLNAINFWKGSGFTDKHIVMGKEL